MAAIKIKQIRIWLIFSKACKHCFGYATVLIYYPSHLEAEVLLENGFMRAKTQPLDFSINLFACTGLLADWMDVLLIWENVRFTVGLFLAHSSPLWDPTSKVLIRISSFTLTSLETDWAVVEASEGVAKHSTPPVSRLIAKKMPIVLPKKMLVYKYSFFPACRYCAWKSQLLIFRSCSL